MYRICNVNRVVRIKRVSVCFYVSNTTQNFSSFQLTPRTVNEIVCSSLFQNHFTHNSRTYVFSTRRVCSRYFDHSRVTVNIRMIQFPCCCSALPPTLRCCFLIFHIDPMIPTNSSYTNPSASVPPYSGCMSAQSIPVPTDCALYALIFTLAVLFYAQNRMEYIVVLRLYTLFHILVLFLALLLTICWAANSRRF